MPSANSASRASGNVRSSMYQFHDVTGSPRLSGPRAVAIRGQAMLTATRQGERAPRRGAHAGESHGNKR
jgi:hypothetical protein